MVCPSDVKLLRRCDTTNSDNPEDSCVTCYCRPMWCINCMGKWYVCFLSNSYRKLIIVLWLYVHECNLNIYLNYRFASRQDQKKPDTWLGSKCPCPTCRSKFCLLDVCLIDIATPQEWKTLQHWTLKYFLFCGMPCNLNAILTNLAKINIYSCCYKCPFIH